MRFRPCIDVHNGKVRQIVGGSLKDLRDEAKVNFESEEDGSYYANLYKKMGLRGGHIIMLNPSTSEYYEENKRQARVAMAAYPEGLQIGGGIHAGNAKEFLDMGASHVIVTSYVFQDGKINYENLRRMVEAVGKEHLVLDLSCRKKDGTYYIVTDRWQRFTQEELTVPFMKKLARYCDEFLIHAVDVEGKASGIEEDVVSLLSQMEGIPITYAGGVGNYEELYKLKVLGKNQVDVTIGSALDLFGGTMDFEKVIDICQ